MILTPGMVTKSLDGTLEVDFLERCNSTGSNNFRWPQDGKDEQVVGREFVIADNADITSVNGRTWQLKTELYSSIERLYGLYKAKYFNE